LIWFTPTAESLAQDKSTFVRGSRGSGKTTLLKSICWDDLVHNESLLMQHSLGDFQHIGVYLRFPDHISTSMGLVDWASLFPDAPDAELEFYRFFTLAVELSCLERALEACHELRVLGHLVVAATQELRLVSEIFDEFPRIAKFADAVPTTFAGAARLFRDIVRQMNEACGRGRLKSFVELLPPREPNDLLTFVTIRLSGVTRLKTRRKGEQAPGFKFCLDDCEVLSSAQQRSINSLVRKAKFPVSWVVSSVGSFLESRSTYLPQQQLTDADRRVVSLDDRKTKDFRQLCQAVVGLRLLYCLPAHNRGDRGANVERVFPLDVRLGAQDVNETIRVIVNRSTSPDAQLLKEAAGRLRAVMEQVSPKLIESDPPSEPWLPYYQTWVLLHWRGREDSFSAAFDPGRLEDLPVQARNLRHRWFQAWLRRKQVGALLHLSARLGFRKLPLAGANIVVALADGSIRDFLEIMGEIYAANVKANRGDPSDLRQLERFATSGSRIAAAAQAEGIYNASEAYFEGIANRIDIEPNAVTRLIEGLGLYTSILQSNANDPTVLGRAERGIFVVRTSPQERAGTRAMDYIRETIRQAELAGYLRPMTVRQRDHEETNLAANAAGPARLLAFRLHRRLAPHFMFSYRGAYEAVSIGAEDLAALCMPGSRVPPRQWASDLAEVVPKSEFQLRLPFDGADDE
jgi:hypothetical protein